MRGNKACAKRAQRHASRNKACETTCQLQQQGVPNDMQQSVRNDMQQSVPNDMQQGVPNDMEVSPEEHRQQPWA
jgi:hypothetical protein